ncbi:phosphate-repressible acid phosphatase [Colletotrichum tofieldiae]|uniref:Phosphate-repressible acid phosphatase n=1 Tax=Colletotrichum tofieldiae TaxID=708197 RepID=A0A166U5R0_9PEZI|nr:phosphate-repressible acid phosphatase [Colletotrichum tofieldiae]GKT93057.1 phosphate-repressible acid phosphatase [Colletotrichum tofieldiae]
MIRLVALLVAAGIAAGAPSRDDSTDWNGYDNYGNGNGHGNDGCSSSVTSTPVNTAADIQYTSTASADVAAAAATAKTESPVSNIKGKVFNRIAQIYLETTAYENAIADPNCQALISQGILQSNLYGVAAPSQPNYVAPASGDYFGTNSDSFLLVDRNVSTIVDLLEDKGISWGDYNEGLPYTGFEGFEYSNPVEGNYARKHNLLVRFDSVTLNPNRLAKLKNLTLFYEDLNQNRLPQWLFVTPNLYNNGHDTNISVSCNWTRSFVEPLLKNPNFNDGNTLVYITWQANGQYPTARNHVAGILLGSAVPQNLVGTVDDAYYNHYSELSSVEANWNLHTLGRWDVGANVWRLVGCKTGDTIRAWSAKIAGDSFANYYWNQSIGGVFSSASNTSHLYVAPNLRIFGGGYRTVLPAIARLWYGSRLPSYYRNIIEVPDALHPPRGYEVPVGLEPAEPITTPIRAYPV